MTTTVEQRYHFIMECLKKMGKSTATTFVVLEHLLHNIDRNNEIKTAFNEIAVETNRNHVAAVRAIRNLREYGVITCLNDNSRKATEALHYRVNFDAWEED